MIPVKVPTVGESISSGTLGSWKKKNGDYVKSGDALFELETEKVTTEVYADVAGVLKTQVNEGDEIQIGQVVAEIDESAKAPETSADETPKKEPAKEQPKASSQPTETAKPSGSADAPVSPAVRRLLEENKLGVADVSGSGKEGRITKADVLAHLEKSTASDDSGPIENRKSKIENTVRETRRKMSPLRRKIADRLLAAQQQAAMLTTFNEVDLSAVIALRKKCQDRFVDAHGVKLGFMSFFVKAAVAALKETPNINARIEGSEIVQNHFYDIGIAISTDKGLLVPVLRAAETLSLAGIEQGILDYAKKARDGKITMGDLEGGVFTITNGGVFGSMLSTPIVNAPQSAILGMHTIVERPVAIEGRVEIRPMMYLALTYDHRLVDGKEAVTFLVRIKEYIEQPALHLLEI